MSKYDEDAQRAVKEAVDRISGFLAGFGVRLDDSHEGALNAIAVMTIATHRCMLDVYRGINNTEAYERVAAQGRQHHIQELWLCDRLDTPWVLLIEQEFPGRRIDPSDFEGFAANGLARILEARKIQEDFEDLMMELLEVLAAANYPETCEDDIRIALLVSNIMFKRQAPTLEYRSHAVETIAEMSAPSHPAWQMVLDRYFKDK